MTRLRPSRGITLIETVAAVVVIAVAASIAVGAISSALPQSARVDMPVAARELARDLLEEILSKPVDDPDGTEESSRTRSNRDDVEDYEDFAEAPPTDPQGQAIAGASAFARSATVLLVPNDQLDGPASPDETGAPFARIAVVVSWGDGSVTLTGLKARSRTSLPAPRSGLVYVGSSRRDNGNSGDEHMEIRIQNRTNKAITISKLTAYWPDVDAVPMYYREVRLNNVKKAEAGALLFDRGVPVTFTPSLVLAAGQEYKVTLFHFRINQDGTGSIPNDLRETPFIIELQTPTGTRYQLEIESIA